MLLILHFKNTNAYTLFTAIELSWERDFMRSWSRSTSAESTMLEWCIRLCRWHRKVQKKLFPDPKCREERAMKWLHNIGTGHTVDKFSVGRHKIVGKDHFEHWCFQMEQQTHAPLFGCVVKNKMCIQPLFKAPKKGKTVLQSIRHQHTRHLPHHQVNEESN